MSSNNRASLLAGLRTGGVRSSLNQMPQTAAPNVSSFPRLDLPMSASVGSSFNQMYPAQAQAQVQAQQQAFQMQMMQMEIMRLQAFAYRPCFQALQQVQQQYQIELTRQQHQHQQQTPSRRASSHYVEPHTAGPAVNSFVNRHSSQADHVRPQFNLNSRSTPEDQVPMTASLGGKFGSRLNPNATAFRMGGFPEEEELNHAVVPGSNAPLNTPTMAASQTTVISGGTPLGVAGWSGNGNGNTSTGVASSSMTASKSDTSLNWRRGTNNSVLNGSRTASLNVKITPPSERISPPSGAVKVHRPEPLRFSVVVNEPSAPLVIVDSSDGEAGEEGYETSSSSSAKSEPTTPPSGGSSVSSGMLPLSPREVASKRLYEGLGIGRPVPQSAAVHTLSFPGPTSAAPPMPHTSAGAAFPGRMVSQPTRQPRGPPSGLDELGPKNFATRIRRKAIGGLGAMLDARVSRREIEAF
ncbi:hypothetical protein EW145_g603 [Phellinidium pouzarii]|uniref:Uncharacterized protein n=1 Tax=Phellinidium pouzarii TaxID=167371 RepID=A0A4S4LJJ7_9AGAM|nr:hypothetical protein EW145_g603 [Phellinidium pouzarii]